MKIIRYEDPSGAFRYGNEQSDGNVLELSGDLFGSLQSTGKTAEVKRRVAPIAPTNLIGIGAIEIYFAYYGKPILWIVVGLANARALTNTETQEFLLLFCRCCMVSLHGAFVAKVERLEKADNLAPAEQFNLALQWFHSVIRHLNLGISRLQSGQPAAATDALDRASIVAGLCLAEMLSLRTKISEPAREEKSVLERKLIASTTDRS